MMYNGPALSKFEVSGATVKTLSSMSIIVPFIMHPVVLARLYRSSTAPITRIQIRRIRMQLNSFFLLIVN